MKIKERIERFWHDKVGDGYPIKGIEGFDGASFVATCKYCNGKLLQDSQGGWFHAT